MDPARPQRPTVKRRPRPASAYIDSPASAYVDAPDLGLHRLAGIPMLENELQNLR
jgi:hypothetical protein